MRMRVTLPCKGSALTQLLVSRTTPPIARILDEALSRDRRGPVLSIEDGATLLQATGPDVSAISAVADALRARAVGEHVTFVVNRNINFTNVCVKRCGFCAFSRTGIDVEGYMLPVDEIVRRADEAYRLGATEVCIQAGLPPNMAADLYERICMAVKEKLPGIHIHAFSPEEVCYGARRNKTTVKDFLRRLKQAGVDTLPGTSAEILDDEVRDKIAKGRLTTREWIEVVTSAHAMGLRTTSTMMFGHCETPRHVAAHLALLRDIQAATGGFTEFVPLGFVAGDAPMYKQKQLPGLRGGPTGRVVRLAHGVSRIMLDGYIDNIQVSWVKEGPKAAQSLLDCGVNDLGGTLMNESISTSAGAAFGQLVTPRQFVDLIRDAGRIPVERRTDYSLHRLYSRHGGAGDQDVGVKLDEVDVHNAEERFGSFHRLIKDNGYRYRDTVPKRNRPPGPHVQDQWLPLDQARQTLEELRDHNSDVCEILVLSGEVHPRSKRRAAWVDRIEALCRLALDLGFLPHTNCGPLNLDEMRRLGAVNVSMGLMLEQCTQAVLPVHRFAPSKVPRLRVEQLYQAGELGIAFTTGVLLGIGEHRDDIIITLQTIAEAHARYGHIGECIVQPYSAGSAQHAPMLPSFPLEQLPDMVALAREILPRDVVVQVPPNLTHHPGILLQCLEAGATDLGGISPNDEVNPDYHFPEPIQLQDLLSSRGYELQPRLPLHPAQYSLVPTQVRPLFRQWEAAYITNAIHCHDVDARQSAAGSQFLR